MRNIYKATLIGPKGKISFVYMSALLFEDAIKALSAWLVAHRGSNLDILAVERVPGIE